MQDGRPFHHDGAAPLLHHDEGLYLHILLPWGSETPLPD